MGTDSVAILRRRGRTSWVRPILGLCVAAVFVYLVVRKLDWQAALDALRSARSSMLLLGLVCLAAGYCVRIIRWWRMLRVLEKSESSSPVTRHSSRATLPVTACAGPFLAGFALNNVLPLRAGDIMRTVAFQKQLGLSPMRILSTLLIERLLDLLALVTVFFIGLSFVQTDIPETFVHMVQLLTAACALMVLFLLFFPKRFQAVGNWFFHRWPLNLMPFVADAFNRFSESLASFRSPVLMLELLGLSLLGWFIEGCVFASVASALSMNAPNPGPWFSMSTGTLATLLPGTPGHVGTFDYFTILGIRAFGASAESATVFALLAHLTLWLPVTIAGLTYFALSRAPKHDNTLSKRIQPQQEPI